MAFVFPTSAELKQVEQIKIPRLTAARPVFEIVPMVDVEAHLLEWEQEGDWVGLQQVRGLGGAFTRVKKVGLNRFAVVPGVYGEFMDLDELEVTTMREIGSWDRPIDVSRKVMRLQDQLLSRRLDRIEYIIWTLLTTGTYAISGDAGVLHTDTYTLQTYAAGTAWATVATSAPIGDFRAVKLLARGKGVSFGRKSWAWMNQVTFNSMMGNTNANDLGGRFQVVGGGLSRSPEHATNILQDEDLPGVRIYDEGYYTDTGVWTPFIANNKVVVTGMRQDGSPIADYALTRNANNPGAAPGSYTEVIQRQEPPKRVEVYDGHNGGLRVYYPGALVIMTV